MSGKIGLTVNQRAHMKLSMLSYYQFGTSSGMITLLDLRLVSTESIFCQSGSLQFEIVLISSAHYLILLIREIIIHQSLTSARVIVIAIQIVMLD